MTSCPICGDNAGSSSTVSRSLEVNCPRCGGYRITFGTTNWDHVPEYAERRFGRASSEPNLVLLGGYAQLFPYLPSRVPAICEWLICLTVEPEFQVDRLADHQERFNDLWAPKFGRRGAAFVYVWHVLRQSRLIDWLLRAFGRGNLL